MKAIHQDRLKRAYGSPRLTVPLRRRGFTYSENQVACLMAKEGVQAKHMSAFRPKTTFQNPDREPSPIQLAVLAKVSRHGEVVISNITYVAIAQGRLCLGVTMDLYIWQVAGWHLAGNMETALVIQAAQKPTPHEGIGSEPVFRSDQECQYTSKALRS